MNLYSATRVAPKGLYQNQLMWFAVGGVIFVVTAASDYRLFERLAYAVYGVGIVLLVAVLIGGKTVKGSSRWLGFGPFGIQPSELAKIAVIMGLAKLFAGDPMDLALRPWRYMVSALALMGVPMLLIMKQPDLGTALILYLIATTIIMVV
ncbi:MAG: FtsW/RodA/SpoVE family cell cycle protein, partial [Polyangia bacterium]